MDTQQLKSIELLQKYLAESSLQERDEIWARVESMGIQGPSVDEYFQNLEDELNSFESSFIGRLAIDSVKGISIPNAGELSQINVNSVTGNFADIWSTAGESNYGMAA